VNADRVAVLSDVHGNTVALEAVLAELEEVAPDLVVFGGDLTWGPEPEATLALVDGLSMPAVFVRGNAERTLLADGDEPTDRKPWLLEQHSPEGRARLATFVEQASVDVTGLGPVRFCHGSPRSDEEVVTPETPDERVRTFMQGVVERARHGAHASPVRPAGRRHAVDQRGKRRDGLRSRPRERRLGVLGPDVELRRTPFSVARAAARYRASGDPAAERMVGMLESPPSYAEIVEYAERLVFAG
jgi:hypothetical protein